MGTHNICFLREIREINVKFQASKSWLNRIVGQVEFNHLLVRGQVIKFNNFTTLHV